MAEQISTGDEEVLWARLDVVSLEADIAYFNARLALLDRFETSIYREAELKAHRELRRVLSEMVILLRGKKVAGEGEPNGDPKS